MNSNQLRFLFWSITIFVCFILFCLWALERDFSLGNLSTEQFNTKVQKENAKIFRLQDSDLFKLAEIVNDYIEISSDVFSIRISKRGGNIISLKLLMYPCVLNDLTNVFLLLNTSEQYFTVALSGLLCKSIDSDVFIDEFFLYNCKEKSFSFYNNITTLDVNLYYENDNFFIIKKFSFKKNSYLVSVKYFIQNKGKDIFKRYLYGKIKVSDKVSHSSWYKFPTASQEFMGFAAGTNKKKFVKISFPDVMKDIFSVQSIGAWVSLIKHYFLFSFILLDQNLYQYESEFLGDNTYSFQFVKCDPLIVLPSTTAEVCYSFYAGPIIGKDLKNIYPGLELTIDYGFFWFLSQPLFKLLSFINSVIKNWGFSIVFVTILIRLVLFPLAAVSYISMGKLRLLQPKIEHLKEIHKDNKQQFSVSLISLYKKEGVNPLSGCLPLVVQIPFFIAFYYVLLQSVELRMAPFIFWIKDLSVNDPYYILPFVMGLSVFLQQKLSPKPTDKIQEVLLLVMPIFLVLLFLQFASGLVLYWIVNNFLSILQQLYIFKKYKY